MILLIKDKRFHRQLTGLSPSWSHASRAGLVAASVPEESSPIDLDSWGGRSAQATSLCKQ